MNTETFDRIRARYPDVTWSCWDADDIDAVVLRGELRVFAQAAVSRLVLASSPLVDVWTHTSDQINAGIMAQVDAKSPAAKTWRDTAERLREALRSDALYRGAL